MTFNVNGLSSPVKICRMTDWARKLDRPICCLQGKKGTRHGIASEGTGGPEAGWQELSHGAV